MVRVLAGIEHASIAFTVALEPKLDAHRAVLENPPSFISDSHCHAYVGVPVEGISALIVRTWSESSFAALILGDVREASADETDTSADVIDERNSGRLALSFTPSSNVYVSPTVRALAEITHCSGALATAPEPAPVAHRPLAEKYAPPQ